MSAATSMRRAWIVAVVCAATTSNCVVGPDFHRPPAPRVSRYTERGVDGTPVADGVAQLVVPGGRLAATWWQLFRSRRLDQIVRIALANNPSVEAATASLRRSQYGLRAGYGVFLPQLDGNAGAQRQRFNAAQFGQDTSSIFNLYTLGGTVGYTLDVFGGRRRQVEALRAQVDVECATVVAARLAVTANVVNTSVARAAYREKIAVTAQLIGDLQRQVEITQAQQTAGLVPEASLLALRTQLETTRASLPPLRQQLAQADFLLSTLAGYAPATWHAPPISLADLSLPRDLPVSLPSELVRQRPDILVAEGALHVASANIGVATAAMLPSISLTGSYGVNSTTLGSLLSHGSLSWSYGANLLAPLFHGGALSNQRKAAIASYRQAFASYRQTVLEALGDVAGSLEALAHDAETLAARMRAAAAATEARKLIEINYQSGVASYIDLIIADAQYQQARLGVIDARAQRLQDTAALFVALGGGWWSAPEAACSTGFSR